MRRMLRQAARIAPGALPMLLLAIAVAVGAQPAPQLRTVEAVIDVQPEDFLNQVDLGSDDAIQVAIFGSEELDVTRIDMASLRFGPAGAPPSADLENPFNFMASLADIDRNGRFDLLVPFSARQAGLAESDEQACLRGSTPETSFAGCNSVVVVASSGSTFVVAAKWNCGLGAELVLLTPALMALHRRRPGRGRAAR